MIMAWLLVTVSLNKYRVRAVYTLNQVVHIVTTTF